MEIYRLNKENLKNAVSVFGDWQETIIWSALQGHMGSVWTDHTEKVSSARVVNGDFCFLAGKPMAEMLQNKPQEHKSDFIIMVPQNREWETIIEKELGSNALKVTRYATKKEKEIFDTGRLMNMISSLGNEYEVKMIDEQIYHQIKTIPWAGDLCSGFHSYNEYREKGIGAVILHKGNVVSGASSYTVYNDGIEIEIDTCPEFRRRGLALACGAKLILECLSRNLYPSWDAQNAGSLALAEKLGYTFEKEYTAYEVTHWK